MSAAGYTHQVNQTTGNVPSADYHTSRSRQIVDDPAGISHSRARSADYLMDRQ